MCLRSTDAYRIWVPNIYYIHLKSLIILCISYIYYFVKRRFDAMKKIRTGPYSQTHLLLLNTITTWWIITMSFVSMRDKQAETAPHTGSSQSKNVAFICITCNAIITTHQSLGILCACCCLHTIWTSQFLHICHKFCYKPNSTLTPIF